MINCVQQNEIWVRAAQDLFDIQQQRKQLEQKEDILIEQLKELSAGLSSYGGGYKYEATTRLGSVDYKAIPQLKGVNVDFYRKAATLVWKLSFVGKIAE